MAKPKKPTESEIAFENLKDRVYNLETGKYIRLADALSYAENGNAFDERVKQLIPSAIPGRLAFCGVAVLFVLVGTIIYGSYQTKKEQPDSFARFSYQCPTATPLMIGFNRGQAICGSVNYDEILANVPDKMMTPVSHGHSLELLLSATCWLRVTELSPEAKVLLEGSYATGFKHSFSFGGETRVEIRSSCPGAVKYVLNGVPTSPVNGSRKPQSSEVVDETL